MTHIGSVYFFRAGESGPVKIGWTAASPRARLMALQPGCWEQLIVIGHIPGQPIEVERQWHARFAELRLVGEWFTPAPHLLRAIALAVAVTPPVKIVSLVQPKTNADVRQWMARKGLDYEGLAALLGFSVPHVRNALNRWVPPAARMCVRIERVTGGEITAAALQCVAARRKTRAEYATRTATQKFTGGREAARAYARGEGRDMKQDAITHGAGRRRPKGAQPTPRILGPAAPSPLT
jgi:DNA-binding transcriptional regulator YdaS (Cro superfamily)